MVAKQVENRHLVVSFRKLLTFTIYQGAGNFPTKPSGYGLGYDVIVHALAVLKGANVLYIRATFYADNLFMYPALVLFSTAARNLLLQRKGTYRM